MPFWFSELKKVRGSGVMRPKFRLLEAVRGNKMTLESQQFSLSMHSCPKCHEFDVPTWCLFFVFWNETWLSTEREVAASQACGGCMAVAAKTHELHAELHCRRLMRAPSRPWAQRSVRPPELTHRPCLLLGPRWCWCPCAGLLTKEDFFLGVRAPHKKMFHALKLEKYADMRHLQFTYICFWIDKIELSHFTNLRIIPIDIH
jgi:hypothetical protein